jgi:histidinol phosphatase-like PHP family hydrolase
MPADSIACSHIDYPVRYRPTGQAGPFDPEAFEEKFRHALRATARSGRALEINTRLPLHAAMSPGGTTKVAPRSPSAATLRGRVD